MPLILVLPSLVNAASASTEGFLRAGISNHPRSSSFRNSMWCTVANSSTDIL